jgi:hypothetical protein
MSLPKIIIIIFKELFFYVRVSLVDSIACIHQVIIPEIAFCCLPMWISVISVDLDQKQKNSSDNAYKHNEKITN